MIAATDEYLERPDEERVREWLMHPACELFLDALAAEQASNEVHALAQMGRVMEQKDIPLTALNALKASSNFATTILMIRSKMDPESSLFRTRLTITSNPNA